MRKRDQAANYYETLGVRFDASQADIKKQFYTLSKQNHPDLHPDDSSASNRFQTISAAYATLSNPSKRASYDREVGMTSTSTWASYPQGASYSSAQTRNGPFGARPPSGLSKRRTTFRGPPPSFYRSGGWGAHSEKRRAAQQSDPSTSGSDASSGSTSSSGGFSPGQGSYDKHWGADVPHFDRQAHFERQEEMDHRLLRRRRARRRREREEGESIDKESTFRLIFVGSLVFAAWLPFLYR